MTSLEFKKHFTLKLKGLGLTKFGSFWFAESDRSVLTIRPYKSRFSNRYLIDVSINVEELSEYKEFIFIKKQLPYGNISKCFPVPYDHPLFFLDNDLPDDERLAQLDMFFKEEIELIVKNFSNKKGLLALIKARKFGVLFDANKIVERWSDD